MEVCPTAEAIDLASVETEFKYEGYLKRQMAAVERQRRQECRAIPEGFGFAGIPGLSVPAGFVNGLPVGLQILGRPFDEGMLLWVAAAHEAATPHHRAAPPL